MEDCPKQFNKNSGHSIRTSCGLDIKLKLNGVISYISMRKPTDEELMNCVRVEMTEDCHWDPYSRGFKASESTCNVSGISEISKNLEEKLAHVENFELRRRVYAVNKYEVETLVSEVSKIQVYDNDYGIGIGYKYRQ